MARKITIKTLCADHAAGYRIGLVTGELFEFGGFQFCLHWDEEGLEITATEISTGMVVSRKRRGWRQSKAPKQDLLKAIQGRVITGQLQRAIEDTREYIESRRTELLERLNAFPAIPINEPIKTKRHES